MELKVPYGRNRFIEINIGDEYVGGVVYPNVVEVYEEGEVFSRAFSNSTSTGEISFDEFLDSSDELLIIVNDGTRPTPTSRVLSFLENKLERKKNFKFMVATGVHRPPTRDEFEFIFGEFYGRWKSRIFVHDCRDEKSMVYLGKSSAGTEMIVNRMGVEAGAILVISSVEPHYFAGYTGGRKSFLPGIASYRTIEQNHKYAVHTVSSALKLSGNPVHEDMIDALRSIAQKPIFSIQTVLDRKRRIYAVEVGDIHRSFVAAVEAARKVFCVKIAKKFDVVLSVAPYPMDVDLYQAQKAVENGKYALKKGGILILVAECRGGIGERVFFDLMASSSKPEEVIEKINEGYKLGYHKAGRLASCATYNQIWCLSELSDDDVKAVFMRPIAELDSAVKEALRLMGPDAQILFLMDGSVTVPYIEGKN